MTVLMALEALLVVAAVVLPLTLSFAVPGDVTLFATVVAASPLLYMMKTVPPVQSLAICPSFPHW